MKRFLLGLVFLQLPILVSWAQTHDLTDEELDAFQVQCQERVDAFQMGLEIIGDKRQTVEIKDHYIHTLPEMFLGNGDPWVDKQGGKHKEVVMQVSSLDKQDRVVITEHPLKKYLYRLRKLPYTSVTIEKAKTCLVSNLYKVSDNLYTGTCTFFQYFTAKSGESVVIKDHTQKDVEIYLQRVEDGSLGTYWNLKFGDINVVETKPE